MTVSDPMRTQRQDRIDRCSLRLIAQAEPPPGAGRSRE